MAAPSLNKVQLIGNLTRDPEMRYTPSGTAVCTFGLATNRSWTPSDGGEKQDEVEFHRIVAWSKLAEICSQLLFKGRKVYVEGRLQTRKWTTNEGTERETTEIVIDQMIALGAPKEGSTGTYTPPVAPAASTPKASKKESDPAPKKSSKPAKKEEEVNVDDIPF